MSINAKHRPDSGEATSPNSAHVQGVHNVQRKSLLDAYVYLFLFGIFGGHHFYLRRTSIGLMYMFSLGLGGVGWFADFFRLPWLVAEANREEEEVARQGFSWARSDDDSEIFCDLRERSLVEAYILWFPFGILGFHQVYVGRPRCALIYFCTLGLLTIGWMVDFFRMPSYVRQANEKIARIRNHENVPTTDECSLVDAYQMALPLGFLGLHYFLMGRYAKGFVYLFTGGLACVGWAVDVLRMPYLVRRHNKEVQENRTWEYHLDDAYIYAIPLGIMGLHRFYLGRPSIGLVYFCTVGLCLIGLLVDLVRMPSLVEDAKEKQRLSRLLNPTTTTYGVLPISTSTNQSRDCRVNVPSQDPPSYFKTEPQPSSSPPSYQQGSEDPSTPTAPPPPLSHAVYKAGESQA